MAQSQPGASLDAWLAHLETLHPQKIDLELLRARTVAQRLGLLPAAMTTITVAGTNGKGSCVAALAALDRGKTLYVAKELACYAPLAEPGFDEALAAFKNVILVRDPLHALASFKRVGLQGGGARRSAPPLLDPPC